MPMAEERRSLTQCAIVCHHSAACVKFSRARDSHLCQLWPLHSPTNPLTADKEPLFQPRLPPGFTASENPAIAYRARKFSLQGGKEAIIDSCREYDPEAFPASPRDMDQLDNIRRDLDTGSFLVIGLWDGEEEGVYRDMVTNEHVTVAARIFDADVANDCISMSSLYVYAVPCNSELQGHVCEYHP